MADYFPCAPSTTMGCWNKHLFILLSCVYPFAVASQFSKFLGGYSAAYNDYFHDGLLKQLNAFRQSTTTATTATTDLPLSTSGLQPAATVNNAVNFATQSTSTFQIYTSDMIPTNPSPPSACAAALSATISCNSTISLMRYMLFTNSDFVKLAD